jgi:sigma-B regulation protein RsbU (phosphoserine phosphatase)
MSILITDDSEDGRELAEAMLIAAGYQDVRAVESAAEAYRILGIGRSATQSPSSVDLILLDIMMPGIDGIEACARIRSEQRYSSVPIIMVTSLADADSLANAFVAGATDYITKPVGRIELLARVRSALKLKAELDRREAREHELLQVLSASGNHRGAPLIDKATGLFTGPVLEAYLATNGNFALGSDTSIIAFLIDRIDACRAVQGDSAAANIVATVAGAVRAVTATVGVIAAAYRGGAIVLIAPGMESKSALKLAEALRTSISDLRIANTESIAANHVTASVAVVTGNVSRNGDRLQLLTRAISALPKIAAAGGNRVMPEFA